MKTLKTAFALCAVAMSLAACGSDETVVVEQTPVVVHQAPPVLGVPAGMTVKEVEQACVNGYDNRTRKCY